MTQEQLAIIFNLRMSRARELERATGKACEAIRRSDPDAEFLCEMAGMTLAEGRAEVARRDANLYGGRQH